MVSIRASTIDLDETFVELETMPAMEPVSAPRRDITAEGFNRRYALTTLLGKGGMGEVRIAADARIGREVAVKMIDAAQGSSPEARARFIREACLQGQLEHPSIVPVYEVGLDDAGNPYFTMKRVRGVTLSEVFQRLRSGDPQAAAKYSRRKLLTAFSNVCLTIDFAHRRGVIHRDLKPANIMLGDFGEVYVLDWGVSKMIGAPERSDVTPIFADEDSLSSTCGLVGTPGYMAPEQIGGPAESLNGRADIYALGAILFEILTLEPLHGRTDRDRALRSTLEGADARPSVRAPALEIPPEVEAICVRATAFVPERRFETARHMHEAIERYLDGDRDQEMRTTRAKEHAARAETLIERAIEGPAENEEESRSLAMNEVGRALALDPQSRPAMKGLVRLLLDPPRITPTATREALAESAQTASRFGASNGVVAYLLSLSSLPMLLMLGVRDWTVLIIACGMSTATMGLLYFCARGSTADNRWYFYLRFTVGSLAIALLSRVFGPYVVIPALALMNTVNYALHPDRGRRAYLLLIGTAVVAGPAVLELTGVIAPSYLFRDGMMCIVPNVVDFPPARTTIYLLFANAGLVIMAVRYVSRVRDALAIAEERLQLYTWHLRHLVPGDSIQRQARSRAIDPSTTQPTSPSA